MSYFFNNLASYFFNNLSWLADVADIVIVAAVIYWLILLVRNTRAEKMLGGLGVIILVFFISGRLELLTLHWILSNFLGSIFIIIIVIFQHDIRRALIQVGKPLGTRDLKGKAGFIEEILNAIFTMSSLGLGALIVIEREVGLKDYIERGVEIDAQVSKEMLLSIFNTSSPLHDGAVIIQGGRLSRASCLLPLTSQDMGSKHGTRHRAAMGLSEETDAIVMVVSEETGEVSLVVDGDIERNLDKAILTTRLQGLIIKGARSKKTFMKWRKS